MESDMKRVCVVGASGKLGQYMVRQRWIGATTWWGFVASAVSLVRDEKIARLFLRIIPVVDIDDQVEACRRVFASDTRWTVVRGSDLEEGESQGLPVWSRHVGDPILASNMTRRVDFALFMVTALENDELIHEAPAIAGCQTPSALAAKAAGQSLA
jgi:hypothetical protein